MRSQGPAIHLVQCSSPISPGVFAMRCKPERIRMDTAGEAADEPD